MSILSGISSFFGLDIGVTGVRLVELHGNATPKVLVKYAYVPLDPKISISDSKADQQKTMAIIADLVKQANLTTKNVAVGLPSSRIFTTVADIDRVPAAEMDKAIHYQADSLIPTPPAESKLDWAMTSEYSPANKAKVEILVSSVPNKFIEERLDMIESIGLNVIAFEPDSLALARALSNPTSAAPQLILDMGSKSTDLVITMQGTPRLVRSIPTGLEAIFRAAQQNLSVDEAQAEQFVRKFGLSKDKLEGQVYKAIDSTVDMLINEIEKSVKFFATRYSDAKLEKIVVAGGASFVPEFPVYLANKFGINVEIANAWRNVAFSADRQNELLAVSSQFSVAVGLAERTE